MALTNAEIISRAEMELIADSKIGPKDVIHTFQGWKERGFSVKKGEHAIVKLTIWKHVTKKVKTEDNAEAETAGGYCIPKQAYFFSTAQVQRMEA